MIKFQVYLPFDQELCEGECILFFSFFNIDFLETGFSIPEALPAKGDISKDNLKLCLLEVSIISLNVKHAVDQPVSLKEGTKQPALLT